MGNLFALPKVVIPEVKPEPEPEPELPPEPVIEQPKKEKPLPQLRLIGFAEAERLTALLSVDGKLNIVTIGDAAEGLQVIAIEPPVLTLKHGDEGDELQMNLYEQAWSHAAGTVASGGSAVGGLPAGSSLPHPAGIGAPGRQGGATGANSPAPPPIPGFGGSNAFPPPAIPGNGVGSAPSAPPVPMMPGLPGMPPGTASSSSNVKNSKKGSRSAKEASSQQTGLPGVPGLPTGK
jgi:hypothetical protein